MPRRVSGGRAHHTGKAVLDVLPVVWCGNKRTIEKALWPPSQGARRVWEAQRSGDQTAVGWAVSMPRSPHRAGDTPFRMGDL